MGFQGSCPGCGGAVEFRFENSVTLSCPHCGSLIGRSGDALEDYGKASDLTQSDSPLQAGISGTVKGRTFDISGRIQLQHPEGAIWSEWFVAFNSGERWGWLAEAQGRYYLTFPKDLPAEADIPDYDEVAIEHKITIPGCGRMVVVEKGEAKVVAAEGEIPISVQPGGDVRFLDLQGSSGKYATLDDNDGQWELFLGREISLRQLGISDAIESRQSELAVAAAVTASCPNCGGAIEVKEPAKAERYACVYCDALLDCNDGNLKFLKALKQKASPTLALGTKGELRDRTYTVIGYVRRRADGFNWDEYLLQTPRLPFHWLIHSDGHWSLGKPVSAGDVTTTYSNAAYKGQNFKLYEASRPVVKAVYGEFYWQVRLGEQVAAWDFVRPPFMLSREVTQPNKKQPNKKKVRRKRRGKGRDSVDQATASQSGYRDRAEVANAYQQQIADLNDESGDEDSQATANIEVNYTLAEYVPVSEIEKAFGKNLPGATGVAPHQPYAYKYLYFPILCVLLVGLLVGGLFTVVKRPRKVGAGVVDVVQQGARIEQGPLTITSGSNVGVTIQSSTLTRKEWVLVTGRFYDEKRKTFVSQKGSGFSALVRGQGARLKVLSAMPSSQYTLQATVTHGSGTSTSTRKVLDEKVSIRVEQNVRSGGNLFALLVVLAVPLGLVGLGHFVFAGWRWQNSNAD